MKKIEKILISIIVLGVILKILLVSWSWILMFVPLYFLVIIYYPLGFCFFNNIELRSIFKKTAYKGISAWRIIGGISLGICHLSAISGVLFKISFLPGAGPLNTAGLFTGLVILLISIVKYKKTKLQFYKNVILRTGILVLLCGLLFILPRVYLIELFMRNHPEYIEAYKEYNKDKANEEKAEKLKIEYEKATEK